MLCIFYQSIITSADVRAKFHFGGSTVIRGHHHTTDQAVVRVHSLDCRDKFLAFGRSLELGTTQRKADQFPPCGDKRNAYRQVEVVRAGGLAICRDAHMLFSKHFGDVRGQTLPDVFKEPSPSSQERLKILAG